MATAAADSNDQVKSLFRSRRIHCLAPVTGDKHVMTIFKCEKISLFSSSNAYTAPSIIAWYVAAWS